MLIKDKLGPKGRLFVKSEWNQIDEDWPCLSYSKEAVGSYLSKEFKPSRDILIYVGVTDENNLVDISFKSALLSAMEIVPNIIGRSKIYVSPEVWKNSLEKYGKRWENAMPVTWAANFVYPYPLAYDIIPETYKLFRDPSKRGQVFEVLETERAGVMELSVKTLSLNLSDNVVNRIRKHEEIRKSYS